MSEIAFVSSYKHSLDPKKRLTIPSGWREFLKKPGAVYVMPDVHQKCLCVFPAEELAQRIDKLRKHSFADKKARQLARVLASQSDLVTLDSQGRIRIKDQLLEFANLTDQVMLVGAFDRFELWNPDLFNSLEGMDRESIKEAANYVDF